MARLAREFGTRTHVVHLSSAEALPSILDARSKGAALTVETCPHYLTFASEDVADGATEFKCAPPIRERANRDALWDGVRQGAIDQVVTDHSPATPALKCIDSGDFMRAWGGIASLQLGLPSVWTEARARGFTLADLARWMCAAPARLVGLADRKGAIAPGYDADFVVWDPDATFAVDPSSLEHRHKVTPYARRPLSGVVEQTFVRGVRVFDRGSFSKPSGRLLRGDRR
jgi:allantoinase